MPEDTTVARAVRGLAHDSESVRLKVALAVGTSPDPGHVGPLVARCAIEPDFFVREMLTWALTRHAPSATVPRLVAELRADRAQARSQALHTLSKIGDRAAYPAITRELLTDPDEEVARAAWRAAVALVPGGAEPALAATLATRLGHGGRDTRRSLSRALIALGAAADPVLDAAAHDPDPRVRAHALATARLALDPDAAFEAGPDAAFDAGRDAASEAGPDAGPGAASGAGSETGSDAGSEAGPGEWRASADR